MIFLPRFNYALAMAILLALGSNWVVDGIGPSIFLTVFLAGAVLFDVTLIPRDTLRVERKVPALLRQAQSFQIALRLCNQGDARASFQVVDSPPGEFDGPPPRITAHLDAHEEAIRSYTLKSYRRGTFAFGSIYYRTTGPLGLIQRQGKVDLPQRVEVLPDFSGEGSRDLQLALAGALRSGRRRSPRRGEGREFESLREHQRDDDFRQIDWKASAKHGKLISRQFETERDQRLMIVLDTGRLMRPKIGNYRKLDYAINAAIHLAQAALHKGDLVGYARFNDELRAFAEPKKGRAQLERLVRDLTPVQPSRFESDYASVFHHLLRSSARRTLVVCFTDLGDASSAQSLLNAALPLLPRHLPVVITISNSEILGVTRHLPENEFEVYRHVAAMEVWDEYQRTLRVLRSRGVLTVSVPAQDLSTATINEYLRIKESARL